ncbi:MAG TPA: TolC family protein [Gemmatimonadales bacterium]|nr:TolC family protein [Gemmatimonadales bacterium]
MTIRIWSLAAGVALSFAGAGLSAQSPADTVHLTIDAAVARALAQGADMRLAHAQVQDAQGQITEALAGALPQITGSVVYTRQFASIYQGTASDTSSIARLFKNSPFGAPNLWNIQIQATQLVWAGGKTGAALSAAKAFREGARDTEQQTAADITFAVRRAYLDAAYSARLLDIARENLAQARDHQRQVQLYHQAGTRADYDLLRAQVDAANQEPSVVAASNGYDVTLRQLKQLLNVPIEQPIALDSPLGEVGDTVLVAVLDSLAPAGRPVLAAAEANVSVEEQAVRAAKADRFPTLSVSTTYSEQAFPQEVFPSGSAFRRGWNGEVRLTVPLFQGFRTTGEIGRARAALLRAQAQRDQVRQQVDAEVAQAKDELVRAQTLLVARRETVRLAQRAEHLAHTRYANGLASQVEVSDARVATQQAEVNDVQAMHDYLVALAQLERALGRPVPLTPRPLDQLAAATTSKDSEP